MKVLKIVLIPIALLGIQACHSPASSDAPIILTFSVYPLRIDKRETSKLVWDTLSADTVSIDNGIGAVAANGQTDISPDVTTTYTLTAKNASGTETASATIEVVEVAVFVLDGSPEKLMTDDGHPYYEGYVKNVGSKPGSDCEIIFQAYSEKPGTNLIDTATDHPGGSGNIVPDQRAHYKAVYFNLTSWDQVLDDVYSMKWTNIAARPESRNGTTGGRIRH